jgi:GMP reductase
MRIINDVKLDFKDVLILPKRSTLESRSQVDVMRTFKFKNSGMEWTGIPIMVSNMDTTGTFEMAKELFKFKMLTCIHKHYSLEEWSEFFQDIKENYNSEILNHFVISTGILDKDIDKLVNIKSMMESFFGTFIGFICIDVANGYTEKFINQIKKIRELYPNNTLIAGNVVTSEMVEELILNGVDIIKTGIGNGSVCTTRIKTGVGYPQLSAVIECADAAHGLKGHLLSDGGCTNSGDFSKAFGAGTDFIMSGGMFAGHDESAGNIVEENGVKFKEYYGMSSDTAMNKHNGGVAKYKASEGKRVLIKYRGPVENTVNDLLGGIRSSCTYVGASTLKELPRRTTFVRVTQQSNEHYGKN